MKGGITLGSFVRSATTEGLVVGFWENQVTLLTLDGQEWGNHIDELVLVPDDQLQPPADAWVRAWRERYHIAQP